MSDVEDPSLHIWEKLSVTLGSLDSHLKRVQAGWLQRASDIDKNHPSYASAICPTPTAAFTMKVGSPQPGRVYSLRRLVVGSTNVTTTAAGSCYVFVSGSDPAQTAYGLNEMVDLSVALPNVAFYGPSEILIRHPDAVWVAVVGGTAGQQYNATAFWESYSDGGYEAQIGL